MIYENLRKFHSSVIKLLDNSFKKNRLVHTYLFNGDRGTFKLDAAKYLSSLILCETNNVCGKCDQCLKIESMTNNNVFLVKAESSTIKKEQILDLEKEFSLTSENKRVFIIDGIEKATTSGANTLLKFLEEANENTYGILLTDNVSLVLPTIVSRSQVVNFAPINRNIMLIELIDNNISQELSAAISSIASSLDEAFNLSKDEKFHEIFKLAKKISESIIVDEYDPVLDYSIDIKFLNGADINLYHNYLIDLLILLENDKLHFKTKNYDGVMFSDFVSLFDNDIDIQKQFNIIQIFMELKEELKYNINVVTAMLAALIKVKRC
ncbi:MAG: hypothetical protein WDA47_08255 [Bacilli bacterium]